MEQSLPFDLRTLRAFRCLRPLKMVSKVPSKLFAQLPANMDKVKNYAVAADSRHLGKIGNSGKKSNNH